MLIHTYYKRNKTVFLVLRFSPEGGQVAIPWRKQMLKFNFMDGMFNIHLHNHFTKKKKKKRAPICSFSLLKRDSTICFQCACKKGKVAYPAHQQGEKISELTAVKSRLCIWFFRGKRIMCMVATIALCLSKGNKEFKEKNKEEFFLIM